MTGPLDSCAAKWNRASKHLRELTNDYRAYSDRHPHRIVQEIDRKTHERVLRLRVSEEPPEVEWGAMAGDVLHNLRALLDNLIEQLTLLNRRSPLDRTEFPIFAAEYGVPGVTVGYGDVQRNGRPDPRSGLFKVRGLRPDHGAFIESLQPYNRRDDIPDHPLLLLQKLDIIDKHRGVPVVALVAGNVSLGLGAGGGYIDYMEVNAWHLSGRLKDGTEVARIRVGPKTNVHMQVRYDTDVVLDEGGPGQGKPLIPTLGDIRSCVLGILTHCGPWFAPEIEQQVRPYKATRAHARSGASRSKRKQKRRRRLR